jgi:hypothetical protein
VIKETGMVVMKEERLVNVLHLLLRLLLLVVQMKMAVRVGRALMVFVAGFWLW